MHCRLPTAVTQARELKRAAAAVEAEKEKMVAEKAALATLQQQVGPASSLCAWGLKFPHSCLACAQSMAALAERRAREAEAGILSHRADVARAVKKTPASPHMCGLC